MWIIDCIDVIGEELSLLKGFSALLVPHEIPLIGLAAALARRPLKERIGLILLVHICPEFRVEPVETLGYFMSPSLVALLHHVSSPY
jgi:hypothetical protein